MIYLVGLLALADFAVGYRFRMKGVGAVATGSALLVVFYCLFADWETDAYVGIGLFFVLAWTILFVGLALLGAGIRRLRSGRAIR